MCCDCVFMLLSSDCTNEDWNIQDKLYTNNLIQLVNFRSLNLPTKSLVYDEWTIEKLRLIFFFLCQSETTSVIITYSFVEMTWSREKINLFWNYFSWVMSLHWRRIKTVKILPWHAKRMEECLQIHKFHCLRYGKICGTTILQLMLLCSRSGCNLQKIWSPRFYYDTASD